MSKHNLKPLILIILVIFICACQGSDTPESIPPTGTSASPIESAVPPTEESLPTATLLPPTAQPSQESVPTADSWLKTYGGSYDDTVDAILPAEQDGFYLAGSTNGRFDIGRSGEAYLLRVDSNGEMLWERTYSNYGSAQAIHPTGDGGLLLSGVISSTAGDSDIFLLQLDEDGNELWSKTFGGPLDEYGMAWPMHDGGYILGGIVVDPSDIVVDDPGVAGYGGLSGRSNIYLARMDAEGNELWSRTIGEDKNVLTSGGLMTADGGFLILGNILNYPQYDDDLILLKIDQSGNEVWSHTWEEGNLDGNALILTSDGNILIAGGYATAQETDMAQKDFLLIKVDPEGNELWQNVFGDPEVYDWAYSIVENSDGSFTVLGDFTRDMFTWDADIVLVKIDQQGQPVWQQTIDTNTHTMLRGVLEHPQGGYVIAGSSYRGSDFDILLIRTDAEGMLENE